MRHRILSGLLVVAVMALMTARPAQAADDDTQAVKAAVATFHDALNVLFTGDVAPMKAIWSHADDVTYMGPVGGMQVGWAQVEPYWDKQAAKKLGGKVNPVDVHITASPTLAVVHYYEKGENVIDGKPQPVNIRATTTFRNEGGKFFDANMKATINGPEGVKVFTEWRSENKFMPPGVEKFGFVENLATFVKGESAMTISWPPYGRFAAGYIKDEAMKWVPESKVGGKVGYALPPGGHPELAAGFALSVASTSKNKELAYLFIQWLNSEEISMQRVQLPYALRDPFRDSHFTSKEYLAKWPDAKDYLAALQAGSKSGLLDLSLIQTDKYEEALRQGISRLWAGEDPKKILDDVAKSWDETTKKVGLDKQKAVYSAWAAKGGAYPKK